MKNQPNVMQLCEDFDEIGEFLRSIRKRRGINQEEAARRLGISQPYLSKLERGGEVSMWLLRGVIREYGLRFFLYG